MDKWGTEKTIKFLEKYSQMPCLWDISNENYKNRDIRATAFKELAQFMNLDCFDGQAAEKKMRAIRGAYLNEKRKVLQSRKSGVYIYKPTLKWFPLADSFLRKNVKCKKIQTYLECEIAVHKADVCDEAKIRGGAKGNGLRKLNVQHFNDETLAVQRDTGKRKSLKIGKRQRKMENQDYVAHLNKAVLSLSKITNNINTETEFVTFGRSVAHQLEILPLEAAYELQAEIQQLISNKKIKIIRGNEAETQFTLNSSENTMSSINNTINCKN